MHQSGRFDVRKLKDSRHRNEIKQKIFTKWWVIHTVHQVLPWWSRSSMMKSGKLTSSCRRRWWFTDHLMEATLNWAASGSRTGWPSSPQLEPIIDSLQRCSDQLSPAEGVVRTRLSAAKQKPQTKSCNLRKCSVFRCLQSNQLVQLTTTNNSKVENSGTSKHLEFSGNY